MIHDFSQVTLKDSAYDVCIVGAGAAGLTLAMDLLRQKKRVLVLESGGLTEDERTARLKEFEILGLPHTGILEGRVRSLGGTTTKWGGQIAEFDELDFEHRPWVAGSGWPFDKSELMPYYKQLANFLELDKDRRQDEEVWSTLGISPPKLSELSLYFTRWLRQPNFATVFKTTLESNPDIDVVLHANLVDFVVDETGQTREAVCTTFGGQRKHFKADAFVLALGAMETSRVLLQPRGDGGRQPWSDSPWIGRNFQDHLAGYCGTVHVKDWRRLTGTFENVFYKSFKYNPKMKLSRKIQEQEGVLNVGGTINFLPQPGAESSTTALKQLLKSARFGEVKPRDVWKVLSDPGTMPSLLGAAYSYSVKHRVYHEKASTQVLLGAECEQEPLGASRISLSSVRDELGMFKASLDWKISPLEVKTIRTFARTAASALEEAGIGSVELDPDLLHDSAAYAQKLHDTYHHMGGTRMAKSDKDGVVDDRLRLFGTTNLYILSASVFPTSSYANPTCTLMALALRLGKDLGAVTH